MFLQEIIWTTIVTFRDVVESKIHDQKGRLVRLIEYTSGEPKEIVKEFIHHDDPHECYNNVMKALIVSMAMHKS